MSRLVRVFTCTSCLDTDNTGAHVDAPSKKPPPGWIAHNEHVLCPMCVAASGLVEHKTEHATWRWRRNKILQEQANVYRQTVKAKLAILDEKFPEPVWGGLNGE